MKRETLRDIQNNVIGFIESDSTGKQVLRDKNNYLIGTYQPRTNDTRDKNNMIVARGNMLVTLLKS